MTNLSDPPPIRVCVLSEFFWPDDAGGTGTVLAELTRVLRGCDPAIAIDAIASRRRYRAAREEDRILPPDDLWNGIRISRVQAPDGVARRTLPRLVANLRFCLAAARQLFAQHRRTPYDLVVVSTAPPLLASVALAFRRLAGVPYLYVVYDLEPDRAVVLRVLPERGAATRLLRACQRRWLAGAARVVVLGRCMRERIGEIYGVDDAKMAVIPIGSDPEEIRPGARAQSAFAARHDLDGRFVVSYSGNFGRYHNFDAVIDAAKRLADADPRVCFVLVGDGAQREAIRRRIETERIPNILLLPFVERAEYADMLAAADVSLVTLEPGMEGLCVPSKFYSILASGRPVIALASERCEICRVLSEEECGLRVDASDADGLVRAVQTLAANPTGTEQMGRRARAALVSRFSAHHVARAYRDAIRQTALTRRRKDGET